MKVKDEHCEQLEQELSETKLSFIKPRITCISQQTTSKLHDNNNNDDDVDVEGIVSTSISKIALDTDQEGWISNNTNFEEESVFINNINTSTSQEIINNKKIMMENKVKKTKNDEGEHIKIDDQQTITLPKKHEEQIIIAKKKQKIKKNTKNVEENWNASMNTTNDEGRQSDMLSQSCPFPGIPLYTKSRRNVKMDKINNTQNENFLVENMYR